MGKCLLDLGTNGMSGYEKLVPLLGIDDSWEQIIFVEPNPECHEYIYNRMGGIKNSKLLEVAVSDKNGDGELITRDDMKGDSAATLMSKEFITASIGEVNQKCPSYLTYKVKTVTIDTILKDITADEIYLKMDVEGSEYAILENFPMEYMPRIKKLFIEFHAHDEQARNRRDNIINHYHSLGIELLPWD